MRSQYPLGDRVEAVTVEDEYGDYAVLGVMPGATGTVVNDARPPNGHRIIDVVWDHGPRLALFISLRDKIKDTDVPEPERRPVVPGASRRRGALGRAS